MDLGQKQNKQALVIGSGIGGLATACLLAKKGYAVTVLEKNDYLGGRAGLVKKDGFVFDKGPSWYLMPDIFDHFFELMEVEREEYLPLERLDPSYRVFFKDEASEGSSLVVDMHSDLSRDEATLEQFERGISKRLREYLARSEMQYEIAKKYFMYKNYDSFLDFISLKLLIQGMRLSVFKKMHSYVARFFKSPFVQKIMEYQLVFLGSSPYNTPALYNIMNHIDFSMGVFYPKGGIYGIVEALVRIGKEHGVSYRTSSEVSQIIVDNGIASGVLLKTGEKIAADIAIANSDIYHTETNLLDKKSQQFSPRYWKQKVVAPSAFIMYIGLKDKVPSLAHHSLLFSRDWKRNFFEIFDAPQLPTDPSLYVCCPSKTDTAVAPEGMENLFVLVPIASGLQVSDTELLNYREKILDVMQDHMNIPNIRQRIQTLQMYSADNFAADYYAYRGSALGLAHTLGQTAIFRTNNVSKKVKNLYYVGAGTNPGIGMPMCLISAELAYKRIVNDKSSGPLASL